MNDAQFFFQIANQCDCFSETFLSLIDDNLIINSFAKHASFFFRFETGWLMVFKVVVNSGVDIKKMWSSSNSHSIAKSEIINVDGSFKHFYKSRRVKYWESSIKPKEVREERS